MLCEHMDQAHLIDDMDKVMLQLGGTARVWRTDRLATVITPGPHLFYVRQQTLAATLRNSSQNSDSLETSEGGAPFSLTSPMTFSTQCATSSGVTRPTAATARHTLSGFVR